MPVKFGGVTVTTHTSEELKHMHPITKSKITSYLQPSQDIVQLIHRLNKKMKNKRILRELYERSLMRKETEREKVNIVIGRLKAAEARQRIHVILMNLDNKVEKKLNQLVFVQPTGVSAVRTEYLVRNKPLEFLMGGKLNPIRDQKEFYLTLSERQRLTTIMGEKIL